MYNVLPSLVLPCPLKTSKKASVQIDSLIKGEANSEVAFATPSK